MGIIYGFYCECAGCGDDHKIRYVGQTVRPLEKRTDEHFKDRRTTAFYDWKVKHGTRHIRSVVLEEKVPRAELDERETHWISELRTFTGDDNGGLNLTRGGNDNFPLTEEEHEAMRLFKRGERGSKTPRILTWEAVADIRRRYRETDDKVTDMAAEYGVSVPTVRVLLQNKTWVDPNYTYETRRKTKEYNKLPPHDIRSMRAKFIAGASHKSLAEAYGVHPGTVYRIVSNTSWYDPDYTPPSREETMARQGPRKK